MKYSAYFLAFLLGSQTAFGMSLAEFDELQNRRKTLEERESRLSNQNLSLEKLIKRSVTPKSIQSDVIGGPKGLSARTQEWTTHAGVWMDEWSKLMNMGKFENAHAVNEAQGGISATFTSFENSYAKLVAANVELINKWQEVIDLLNGMETLPSADIESAKDLTAELNSRKARMVELSKKHHEEIQAFTSDQYAQIVVVVKDYYAKRGRDALLRLPELEQTLASIQSVVSFETKFRADIGEMKRQGLALQRSIANLHVYDARKKFADMQSYRAKLESSLQEANLPKSLEDSERAFLNTLFRTAETDLKNFEAKYPGRNAIVFFATLERKRLTADCKDPVLRLQRDCELLRTLNRIKLDNQTVKTFSDADLEYFEKQLIKVRETTGLGAL